MVKNKSAELLNFRPGDLAARIEDTANREARSTSDVIRRALEMYLGLEQLQPLATYLGAAAYFAAVAKAAADLGLFSRECYENIVEAVANSEDQVRDKLEPLFRQLYPGEITPKESWAAKCNE